MVRGAIEAGKRTCGTGKGSRVIPRGGKWYGRGQENVVIVRR